MFVRSLNLGIKVNQPHPNLVMILIFVMLVKIARTVHYFLKIFLRKFLEEILKNDELLISLKPKVQEFIKNIVKKVN